MVLHHWAAAELGHAGAATLAVIDFRDRVRDRAGEWLQVNVADIVGFLRGLFGRDKVLAAVRDLERRGWIERNDKTILVGQLWQRQTEIKLRADVINAWLAENIIESNGCDFSTSGESRNSISEHEKSSPRARNVDRKTKEVGVGKATTTKQGEEAPEAWKKALELEVERERKKRPIRNLGGFRASLLARYERDGGPGQDVIDELDNKARNAVAVADVALDEKALAAGQQFLLDVRRRRQSTAA